MTRTLIIEQAKKFRRFKKNGLRLSRAADGECKPIFSRKITSDEKDFLKVWLYFLEMWKLLFLAIFHLHTCEICLRDILTQGIR